MEDPTGRCYICYLPMYSPPMLCVGGNIYIYKVHSGIFRYAVYFSTSYSYIYSLSYTPNSVGLSHRNADVSYSLHTVGALQGHVLCCHKLCKSTYKCYTIYGHVILLS